MYDLKEQMSEPFFLNITISVDSIVAAKEMLGREKLIKLPDHSERLLAGIVTAVAIIGEHRRNGADHYNVDLTIRSSMYKLMLQGGSRVFINKSILECIKVILKEHNILENSCFCDKFSM